MCQGLTHPRGDLGKMIREDKVARYFERICPTCGRVQGIARIRKQDSN